MFTVEKPGCRSQLGELESAAAAGVRCARALQCHNDFITNPGARDGDYRVGGVSTDVERGGMLVE